MFIYSVSVLKLTGYLCIYVGCVLIVIGLTLPYLFVVCNWTETSEIIFTKNSASLAIILPSYILLGTVVGGLLCWLLFWVSLEGKP